MVRRSTDPLKCGESLRDDRKNTLDCRVQRMPVKISNTIEISYQKSTRLKINRYVFTASAETLPIYYIGVTRTICEMIASAAAIYYTILYCSPLIEEIIQILQLIFYDSNKTAIRWLM